MNGISRKDKQHYFPALTGLRAVAAILVFAHHALGDTFKNVPVLHTVALEGHMGVSIFFVLSGFLIGVRHNSEVTIWNSADIKNYLVQRWARLYPLYFICTIAALLFTQDYRPASWVVNLLMLQGLFSDYTFSGIVVGWTLTIEVCFYLAAPFLLSYWKKIGLGGSIGICIVTGILIAALGNLIFSDGFIPSLSFFVRMTFFGRCIEFCLGIWLAYQYVNSITADVAAQASPFKIWTMIGVSGIAISIFLFSQLTTTPSPLRPFLFHSLNNLILPVFILALLWGLCQEKTWLSRMLGSRFGQELGKGSYIFYLVHFTFGFDVLYFHVWQSRLGVLLLLLAISVAGYHLLEAPLQKWIMVRWRKKRVNFAASSRFTDS